MLKDDRQVALERNLERAILGNRDDCLDQRADKLTGFGAGVFAAKRAPR